MDIKDFDPSVLHSPDARVRDAMKASNELPKESGADRLELNPGQTESLVVEYTIDDMDKIIGTMISGGYTSVEEANKAMLIMLSNQKDMVMALEAQEHMINQGKVDFDSAIESRLEQVDLAQTIGLTLREIIAMIREDGSKPEWLEACDRAEILVTTATNKVTDYDGNMLLIAASLRGLREEKSLRSVGSAVRERLFHLTDAAAMVLDDSRRNMLALKETAEKLAGEMTKLRKELEEAQGPMH